MTQTTGYKTDNIGSYIVKDPDSTLDYSVDWGEWLVEGDTLTNSTWTIQTISGDASPMTQTTSAVQSSGKATVWLTAGTAGNNYRITNTIETAAGLTDERYFRIFVRDRTA